MIELLSFEQPCPDCGDDLIIISGLPNNGIVIVCDCGYAEYGIKINEDIKLIERTKPAFPAME